MSRRPHQIGVITCTAGILAGDPVLAGTRIPAAMIARAGASAKESWPDITDDDIAACVAWWEGSQEATLYAVRDLVDQGRWATPQEVRYTLQAIKAQVDGALAEGAATKRQWRLVYLELVRDAANYLISSPHESADWAPLHDALDRMNRLDGHS